MRIYDKQTLCYKQQKNNKKRIKVLKNDGKSINVEQINMNEKSKKKKDYFVATKINFSFVFRFGLK